MKSNTHNFTVEKLDDRTLPSATVVDLTTVGAEAVADGYIVRQVDAQPTGTGYIHSFVRVQGAASGGGSQQGYNTDARPLQFDENKTAQFTRSITVADVPTTVVNGTVYRQFLLDVNQKSSSPLLSVDQVKLFFGRRPDLTGYNPADGTLAGQAAAFDMDANGDVTFLLDARLNSGSGSGDMMLLVPNSVFANAAPTDFVYLYSQMGATAGATANGGFEEWSVPSTPQSQDPGTGSLSGYVFVDSNRDGVRDEWERPLAGVTITLQGVDESGQTVVLVTTTDDNGFYQFTGLRAGVYTITETQPEFGALIDGEDYLGTIDGEIVGSLSDDKFFNIYLPAGKSGINYNFTEYFTE